MASVDSKVLHPTWNPITKTGDLHHDPTRVEVITGLGGLNRLLKSLGFFHSAEV